MVLSQYIKEPDELGLEDQQSSGVAPEYIKEPEDLSIDIPALSYRNMKEPEFVSSKSERAKLIRPTSTEQRLTQAQDFITADQTRQHEQQLIKDLQAKIDRGEPIDPIQMGYYRDYLDIPEPETQMRVPEKRETLTAKGWQPASKVGELPQEVDLTTGEILPSKPKQEPPLISPVEAFKEQWKTSAYQSSQSAFGTLLQMGLSTIKGVEDLNRKIPTPQFIKNVRNKIANSIGYDIEGVEQKSREKLDQLILDTALYRKQIGDEIRKEGGIAAEVAQNIGDEFLSSAVALTGLGALKLFGEASTIKESLKNAAKLAGITYATTEGNAVDRAKAATGAGLFMLTPIPAGRMAKNWSAKLVNTALNFGVDLFTGKIGQAVTEAKNKAIEKGEPDKWKEELTTTLTPALLLEGAFGLLARAKTPQQVNKVKSLYNELPPEILDSIKKVSPKMNAEWEKTVASEEATKAEVKPEQTVNAVEVNILKESGIPKKEIGDYITDQDANGATLRKHADAVNAGEESITDAAKTVANDWQSKKAQLTKEPPKEFISGTALNKATAEIERKSAGLPPATETEKKSMPLEWERAKQTIKDDPLAPKRLIDSIISDPNKSLSDTDAAVLLRHKVALLDEVNKAAGETNSAKTDSEKATAQEHFDTALNDLETLMNAAKSGLTTWGRTGRWAQMIAAEDYTLGNMLMRAKAKKGGQELTGEEKLKIQMLQKELETAQKRVAETEIKLKDTDKTAHDYAEKMFRDFVSETIGRGDKSPTFSEKAITFLDEQANAARERIKKRRAEGRMLAGIDPVELADYSTIGASHIAKGIRDIGVWSAKMVSEFGEYIKPYLKQIWEASKKLTGETRVKERIKEPKIKEKGIVSRSLVRELMRDEVDSGVKTLDEAISNVRNILLKDNPDITIRQVRDIFSDYGKSSMPSQEQTDVVLRDLRAQSQKQSQLEDVMSGKSPLKTGMGRDAPSQKVRELTKQVHSAMKKMGIVTRDPEQQLKTSLDAIKTRLSNSIEDLTQAIGKREKLVINKSQISYDAEANALKSRRDVLRQQYDEMFPKQPMTDAERYDNALKTTQRSLEGWEKKLTDAKKGIFPPEIKKGIETTKEMMSIRKQRDVAKSEFEKLRDLAMPDRKDKLALQIYGRRLDRRITELETRLKTGVLPAKKTKTELALDDETTRKKFELSKLEQRWKEMQFDLQLKQRTFTQKVWDYAKEPFNVARSLLSSFDLSAVLRQGAFIGFAHPIRAVKSIVPMLRAFASEREAYKIEQEILTRPNALLYKKAKLELTSTSGKLTGREETFMSRIAGKIPGIGQSQRAYITYLNKLRADSFDAILKSIAKTGKPTDIELNAISDYINIASGRGNMGKAAMASETLATILWSPRLLVSRFQLLAGKPLYHGSARTRKLIAGEYARFLIGAGVVYALGKASGAEIEDDPRSSDFGKLKFGNTRIDPLAGLSQTTVFLTRIITGQKKTAKGKIEDIRGERAKFGTGVSDVIQNFLRAKLSPLLGTAVDIAEGKTVVGEKVTPASAITRNFVPLSMNDIYDVMVEQGVTRGTAITLLSIFGMGVQSYNPNDKNKISNIDKLIAKLRKI